MTQYIEKTPVVAELKRLQDALQDPAMNRESMQDYAHGGNKIINEIRSFLDTLEVKEVELEVEGEYDCDDDTSWISFDSWIISSAKVGKKIKALIIKD